MAVNTDAEFDKAALGGPGVAPSGESLETEKLLSAAGTPDAARRHDLRLSGPFAVNLGSVKSLDADLNGRSTPLRSGSMGHLRAPPRSPSHVSVRSRTSSVGTAAKEQPEPRDYLLLAFCSCFCFFWPLSIAALVFSILSRNSLQQGDLDGARRLGRLARLLSFVSMGLGLLMIVVYVTVTAVS
ncbi:trafficking regulator of GLUT4 1-like isoform X2 [Scleropages formosus]|uniref:Trafficking regulator of GLUT4 (SLC2A4) 1a n=1 Tax=Scleropages formosus TaxID=113540 RepID=A0A8C9SST4_SCLFO|nr:trafficking regulator of GLUT4 1-like isoform X2 [Scleropages formosus]